jgi:hypothetical protein
LLKSIKEVNNEPQPTFSARMEYLSKVPAQTLAVFATYKALPREKRGQRERVAVEEILNQYEQARKTCAGRT